MGTGLADCFGGGSKPSSTVPAPSTCSSTTGSFFRRLKRKSSRHAIGDMDASIGDASARIPGQGSHDSEVPPPTYLEATAGRKPEPPETSAATKRGQDPGSSHCTPSAGPSTPSWPKHTQCSRPLWYDEVSTAIEDRRRKSEEATGVQGTRYEAEALGTLGEANTAFQTLCRLHYLKETDINELAEDETEAAKLRLLHRKRYDVFGPER